MKICFHIMTVTILVTTIYAGTILFSSEAFFAGMPVFFLWTVFSVFLISGVMWIVYLTDTDSASEAESVKENGRSGR